MADKNVTLKQYNGSGYDNIYPKTIPQQIDGLINGSYEVGDIRSSAKNISSTTWLECNGEVYDETYYTELTTILPKDITNTGYWKQTVHLSGLPDESSIAYASNNSNIFLALINPNGTGSDDHTLYKSDSKNRPYTKVSNFPGIRFGYLFFLEDIFIYGYQATWYSSQDGETWNQIIFPNHMAYQLKRFCKSNGFYIASGLLYQSSTGTTKSVGFIYSTDLVNWTQSNLDMATDYIVYTPPMWTGSYWVFCRQSGTEKHKINYQAGTPGVIFGSSWTKSSETISHSRDCKTIQILNNYVIYIFQGMYVVTASKSQPYTKIAEASPLTVFSSSDLGMVYENNGKFFLIITNGSVYYINNLETLSMLKLVEGADSTSTGYGCIYYSNDYFLVKYSSRGQCSETRCILPTITNIDTQNKVKAYIKAK